jgi:hypothetical protein
MGAFQKFFFSSIIYNSQNISALSVRSHWEEISFCGLTNAGIETTENPYLFGALSSGV